MLLLSNPLVRELVRERADFIHNFANVDVHLTFPACLFLTRMKQVRFVPVRRVVMDRPHVDQNTCPTANVVTADTEKRRGEEGKTCSHEPLREALTADHVSGMLNVSHFSTQKPQSSAKQLKY